MLHYEKYFYERSICDLKTWLKTLLLGVTSGLAAAAGGWLWKNCAEGKVDELKKQYASNQNTSQK